MPDIAVGGDNIGRGPGRLIGKEESFASPQWTENAPFFVEIDTSDPDGSG